MFHTMVLRHAKQTPQSLAFDSLSQDWTFAQLDVDVRAVAAALSKLREAEPRLVGIHCGNLYWHWVFVLALASLGVASASLPESSNPSFLRDIRLLEPDLILSLGGLSLQDVQVLEVNEGWLARVREAEPQSVDISIDCDTICRYAIAAGTDAERHVLSMSFRQAEMAIMHMIFQDQILARAPIERPHVLSTIGVISLTGFIVGCSALCGGSPLNFVSHTDIGILIARKIATVAVVTPGHLAHIIEVLPPGMRPLDTLKLVVTGGRLSRALRDKTLEKLTRSFVVAYGTDETGAIAVGDAASFETEHMVGTPLPWVSLQVVDPQGSRVPDGEEGILRIRSSGLLNGYVDGHKTQSRHFSEGWFYPGDRGILDAGKKLRITGRVDDLVSLGGEKFDLGVIDDIARDILGQRELGSFLSLDEAGRDRLNIAFASSERFNTDHLAQALRAFYPTLPPVCVMTVDHIPWSLDGHVDRDRLSQAFRRSENTLR
ncbi:class I adenylate-forming enzyme family protein [Asaia sp. HN010]|uniref:class I adenylate-forming enzyme family protein n=1 Tax=Asaia sp. HN010 TaxID=3081233 RepID=UPI003017FA19